MRSVKTGFQYGGIVISILLSGNPVFASDSNLAKVEASSANAAVMEECLLNAGLGNMQAIKNMAQKFGPEAVLDMMFSSVNPAFQQALLTKPNNDPARPVKNIEDMRENKYFQHAITSGGISAPWVKVTADGRVIAPQIKTDNPSADNWLRLPFATPSNAKPAQEVKAAEPVIGGAAQRY